MSEIVYKEESFRLLGSFEVETRLVGQFGEDSLVYERALL